MIRTLTLYKFQRLGNAEVKAEKLRKLFGNDDYAVLKMEEEDFYRVVELLNK